MKKRAASASANAAATVFTHVRLLLAYPLAWILSTLSIKSPLSIRATVSLVLGEQAIGPTASGFSEDGSICSAVSSILGAPEILPTASGESPALVPVLQTPSAKSETVSQKLNLVKMAKAFPLP